MLDIATISRMSAGDTKGHPCSTCNTYTTHQPQYVYHKSSILVLCIFINEWTIHVQYAAWLGFFHCSNIQPMGMKHKTHGPLLVLLVSLPECTFSLQQEAVLLAIDVSIYFILAVHVYLLDILHTASFKAKSNWLPNHPFIYISTRGTWTLKLCLMTYV